MIEPDPQVRRKTIKDLQEKRAAGALSPTETDALLSLEKEETSYEESPKVQEKAVPVVTKSQERREAVQRPSGSKKK